MKCTVVYGEGIEAEHRFYTDYLYSHWNAVYKDEDLRDLDLQDSMYAAFMRTIGFLMKDNQVIGFAKEVEGKTLDFDAADISA